MQHLLAAFMKTLRLLLRLRLRRRRRALVTTEKQVIHLPMGVSPKKFQHIPALFWSSLYISMGSSQMHLSTRLFQKVTTDFHLTQESVPGAVGLMITWVRHYDRVALFTPSVGRMF